MAVTVNYGLYGRSKLESYPPGLAFAGVHGGRSRAICDRVAALGNGDGIGSQIFLGRIPSSAVILPTSTIWFGAFGTNVTLDIGDANDDDGLATDIAVASAGSSPVIEAVAIVDSAGKRLWEYLGYTSDPHKDIDLIATIATAAVSTTTGKLAWQIDYSND